MVQAITTNNYMIKFENTNDVISISFLNTYGHLVYSGKIKLSTLETIYYYLLNFSNDYISIFYNIPISNNIFKYSLYINNLSCDYDEYSIIIAREQIYDSDLNEIILKENIDNLDLEILICNLHNIINSIEGKLQKYG